MSGLTLIHYPGIQNDEALFAAPLYNPAEGVFHVKISHHQIPVMDMSYIGALKTWLYAPIFKVFQPSYLSIRLPVLFLGALTIWIFFRWLEIVHGRRAAWIGALLLASDSMFLLTTCFDWGPVVLQHFLTLLGMVLVVRKRNLVNLAGGFFCFGLAAWDKALFAWIFGGLTLAVVIVFPGALRRALSWKSAAVASLGFVAGAFPLIAYNVSQNFPTFHAASGFSTQELYPKALVARSTWEGQSLFGYIMNQDDAPNPSDPINLLEKVSFKVREWGGAHQTNGLFWAGLIALILLLPSMWWQKAGRLALFCLIVIVTAWLQMAVTHGTGGAAHHVVLLWPFPHAVMAVLFAEASQRLADAGWARIADWLLGIGLAIVIGWNLLVTNQYLYQFARNGAAGSWSDAIYALAADLHRGNSLQQGSKIAVLDWGIVTPLEALEQGRLPLRWSADPFQTVAPGQAAPAPDPALLRDPETLWLGHADGYEQFPGINAGLDAFIKQAGFQKVALRTYRDTNGRAIFQAFQLVGQTVLLSAP
ncbi:MAG: hypothetical protein M3Y27_01020 [Acidobacteriota bacterium]|nr:hypothetical protein [Acidobacteriota bacterium]